MCILKSPNSGRSTARRTFYFIDWWHAFSVNILVCIPCAQFYFHVFAKKKSSRSKKKKLINRQIISFLQNISSIFRSRMSCYRSVSQSKYQTRRRPRLASLDHSRQRRSHFCCRGISSDSDASESVSSVRNANYCVIYVCCIVISMNGGQATGEKKYSFFIW